jgi:hypothetical protein
VLHVGQCQRAATCIVRPKRPTIVEQQGILGTIKIGDWIEVDSDYSKGMVVSNGGIGCV